MIWFYFVALTESPMLYLLVFGIGVIVGAFSHKWLAAEVKSVTGVDAQGVANKVNDAAKKV